MTRNGRLPWVLVLALIVAAGLVAGCRSSGDTKDEKKTEMTDEEKEKAIVKTSENPWGFVPFSFHLTGPQSSATTCDVHGLDLVSRSIKLFNGQYPLDEAYQKEMLARFPNCDDPVLYIEAHKGKTFVTRSVCTRCCEERDAYLVKRFGK
jgi:hypothetical protein